MHDLLELRTALGTIAVFESGTGNPIFFWPSLFTDHRLYDEMVAGLVDSGWRTFAIDGPGFGKSDPPSRLVQPGEYADLVVEIADQLGIDTFSFAGCSWGGMVGAHLGARHPGRLDALLLMNTPLLPSRGGHRLEYWGARLAVSSSQLASGTAKDMLGKRTLEDPAKVERFTGPFASFEGGPAARTVDVTLRHSDGLEHVLPSLTLPVTIMMGAEDTLYPTDELMPIARLATSAEIVVVPNCGHIIPIEAPEAAIAALVKAGPSRTLDTAQTPLSKAGTDPMNILVVNSSLHGAASSTKTMVAAYLEEVADEHPTIVEHDLATDPIPHLSMAAAAAIRGEAGAAEDKLSVSDALIAEVEKADVLVLGVPMYNFTIPSTLKTWIDHIVRARRTFSYEQGQPQGLLDSSKKVLLFLSSDGVYTAGPTAPMDFVEPYLRTILGFVGLTDVTVIRAEGQAVPDLARSNRSDAIESARDLAR